MLSPIDLGIIIVYLAAVVAAGILSRGRQDSAEDYFTAGGTLGSLFGSVLVGLSIAATLFSGISFLAYPSVVYSTGLGLLVGLVVFPLAWVVLAYWFLPRYLARAGGQPYAIIERRFGVGARSAAAAMFILLRVGWMAALIYAPTIAIMAAAGLGPGWFWPLVLAIGLSSTLYTVLGGIRGVIVTDAIQFLIIAAGLGLTVAYVLLRLPVPLEQAWAELGQSGRLDWFDPSFDFSKTLTIWSLLIGFTVANMGSYLADQMSLQRYLAAGSLRAASRSFAINIVGVMIVLVMLAGVGLALATWYQHVSDPNLPADADQVFPYFVATQLPAGLAGMLLAAILAATMSSMTSGINALAGTITLDFRVRFGSPLTAREQVRYARVTSLMIGLLATGVAGLVAHLGSIFDITQSLLGVFLGPLLTCIVLAVTTVRLRGEAVILGLVLGCGAGWAVIIWSMTVSPISSLWVAPTAFAVSMLAAVGGGRWLPAKELAMTPPHRPDILPADSINDVDDPLTKHSLERSR